MKKTLTILAAVLACMTAGAQKWIGGTATLGVADYELDPDVKAKAEKTFHIYPTVGFTYDEQWEYGVSFGLGHKRNIGGKFYSKRITDIMVQPFVRYCLWDNGIRFEKGDLSFFVQGNLLFDHRSSPYDIENGGGHGFKTWEEERATFGLSFQPGLKYCYNDHYVFTFTFADLYANTCKFTTNASLDENGEMVAKRHSTKSSDAGLEVGNLVISIAYQF